MQVDWTAIIAAIFGSGGLGVALVNYLTKRQHNKDKRKAQENFKKLDEVYKTLERIRYATRANRVCVLKTENGGGIPKPGSDVTSSVVHENASPDMTKELMASWQKVRLNGVWAPIIKHIAEDRCATLVPIPEMGPHFDFLLESNCAKVHFVLIVQTPSAMFYMSVHLAEGIELSPQEQSEIYQGVRRLQQLF
jgi:hypothetical protein